MNRELRRFNQTVRRFYQVTAYHEAGHTVVSWALHVPVRRATIVREGEAAGHVLNRRMNQNTILAVEYGGRFSTARVEAEKRVAVSMAGELAQRKFAPRSWRSSHGAGDRDGIIPILEQYGSRRDGAIDVRAHYKLLREWTADIVESRWYLVKAVADALIKRRTLSGKEVTEVILDAQDKHFGLPAGSSRKLREKLRAVQP